MLRASREPTGEDPWLIVKILLFVTGASFGMAGMVSGTDWPVTVGILLLLAGVVLRLMTRRVNPPDLRKASDDPAEEDPEDRA